MKIQYLHNLSSSFLLWLDHTLLDEGEAFDNKSSLLYYDKNENSFPSSFSSPYKQWVSNSEITSANIPSGVYVDGNFVQRGVSGLHIDFNNGRATFNQTINPNSVVSGDYAHKNFNVYIPTDFQQEILAERRFVVNNNRYGPDELSGIAPYTYAVPACFINVMNPENKPFSFGKSDESRTQIRVVTITDNSYLLDGAISLFNDKARSNIKIFSDSFSVMPWNEYGDYKTPNQPYNYIQSLNNNIGSIAHIDKVSSYKLLLSNQEDWPNNLTVGVSDFYIFDPRIPN